MLSALALGLLVAFAIRHRPRPAAPLHGRRGRADDRPDRRRADRPAPAARGDRPPAVLRVRPGHPARAAGGRGRAGAPPSSSTRSSTRSSSASRGWSTRPASGRRSPTSPTITVASDLHNNVIALPILERAANGGPLLFAGDLTDRGSPLETRLVSRVVELGKPFVFVSGNHDSDSLEHDLAGAGAIVLTENGRLNAGRDATATSSRRSPACGSPATATRSSAARARTSRTATSRRRRPRSRTPSRRGCDR